MNFIKFLALFLIIWISTQMVRSYIAQRRKQSLSRQKKAKQVDNMVQCQQCGTYLPENKAYQAHQHYYCNKAHADKDTNNTT